MPCSRQLRDHLVIRKALSENPDLLEAYSKVKLDYMNRPFPDGQFPNWEEYSANKRPILAKILQHTTLPKDAREFYGEGADESFDIAPYLWTPVSE